MRPPAGPPAGERAYPPAPRTVPHPLGLAAPSRLAHLRPGAAALAALLGPAAAVGAAAAGPPGAVAAAAGLVLVAASFGISTVLVAAADLRSPALTLPTALLTYSVKFSLLGVAAFALTRGPARWHPVAGYSVLAGTAAWVGAQAWWFWRAPRPYLVLADPRRPGAAPPAPGGPRPGAGAPGAGC